MEDPKPVEVIQPDRVPQPLPPATPMAPIAPLTSVDTSLPSQPIVDAAPQQPVPMSPADPLPAAWQFRSESGPETAAQYELPGRQNTPAEVTWTAAEFMAHDKSPLWYMVLGGIGLLVTIGIYLITKDKITTGIIMLCGVMLGVFAARKPRQQTYVMNDYGLKIGTKIYAFQDYKSFAISEDENGASIIFMPLKRFMPALTVYLSKDIEEDAVDFLSVTLPLAQHKQDAVDSLLKRIRF